MAEVQKCPELKGLENINPGSIAGRLVCAFHDAPTSRDVAAGLVKKSDTLENTAKNMNFKSRTDAAVEAAGG